jgi:diguanylate cyclase (GGDEF)-like protein/PAS domain S-box-containing protein
VPKRSHAILDAVPDPVVVIGADVRLTFANRAAVERFGWTRDELIGRNVTDLVHRDDVVTALASLDSVQRKDVGTLVTIRLRDHTGLYGTFEVRGRSAVDDPEVDGVVLLMRDVTHRSRWDLDGGTDAVSRTVMQYAPGITMLLSRDGHLRSATRAFTSTLSRDLESTLGMPLWQLAAEGDAEMVMLQLLSVLRDGGSRSFEAWMARGEGLAPIPLQMTVVNLLDDPNIDGLVVTALEISALVEARQQMHHHASHDHLTGLVNRRCLRERLADALHDARRDGTSVAVLYGDIDGFKAVNDRFGHRAGDEVLIEVARRFRGSLRDDDVIGRYGGDEFVIVLHDADALTAAFAKQRVESSLNDSIRLSNGSTVSVKASVGYVVDDGSTDLDDLLAAADAVMYREKAPAS